MNEQMFNELDEVLSKTEGDIIEFRVYKGGNFGHLVRLGEKYDRQVFGMDTFYGLESPCQFRDKNLHGYTCYPKGYAKSNIDITKANIANIAGKDAKYHLYTGSIMDTMSRIPENKKFAVAIVDLLQYWPTKKVLEFLKNHMVDGGIIYFQHYIFNDLTMSSMAVEEFLMDMHASIRHYDDLIVNGNIAQIKRIIWQPEGNKEIKSKRVRKVSKKKLKEIISDDVEVSTQVDEVKASDPDITIALVLRSGGDTYNSRYVNALATNIRNNTTKNITVTVLTDIPDGIDEDVVDTIIPLKHKYKGWWSKIELFRPDVFSTKMVAFFDLDTVIVDNIDDILSAEVDFSGIRDLYHWDILQTGIMVWNSNMNHQIYTAFAENPLKAISDFSQGDANWVRAHISEYDYLQDLYPDKIVSFKANCLNKHTGAVTIPRNASIICFHGKPRPHTITNKTITDHWKY